MSTDTAAGRALHRATFYADAAAADPELRLLNMRELAAIREAHVPDTWFSPATPERPYRLWRGRCSCGTQAHPSRDLATVVDNLTRHLSDVIDFTKGRKVAETKARAEHDRIAAEIDAALEDGWRAR